MPALTAVAPAWGRAIAAKVRVTLRGESSEIQRNVAFLQREVRPGGDAVIISYMSGIYYLATRKTNPLDIPGDSELLYRRDLMKQVEYAYRRRGLVIGDTRTVTKDFFATILRHDPARPRIEGGTMVVFPGP